MLRSRLQLRHMVTATWLQVCLENNVSLLPYSPLAGGTLSGKYITGEEAENSRLNIFQGYMARYNKSAAREATKEYMKVLPHLRLRT